LFRTQRGDEERDAGHVAVRPIQARDGSLLNRIDAAGEDDRDARAGRLRRQRGAATRNDHRDLPANKIRQECRHAVEMPLGPAIFDGDVLPCRVAGFIERAVKGIDLPAFAIERSGMDIADHRHRLLRARVERAKLR
jgi:hypothetical protein